MLKYSLIGGHGCIVVLLVAPQALPAHRLAPKPSGFVNAQLI
jgi:hypothetical protein